MLEERLTADCSYLVLIRLFAPNKGVQSLSIGTIGTVIVNPDVGQA